ncbi:hypothetical protein BV898_09322 [Hypsibius exemplaris]|uniref:Uncharacterized protein n=1 Tax=Hypsibius exemplaris TaxID=2072580 RepID=A0A1W0WMY0_HYPEX|nr:hypothetical protein BV898_09322 [Hypsibius exemplaris]
MWNSHPIDRSPTSSTENQEETMPYFKRLCFEDGESTPGTPPAKKSFSQLKSLECELNRMDLSEDNLLFSPSRTETTSKTPLSPAYDSSGVFSDFSPSSPPRKTPLNPQFLLTTPAPVSKAAARMKRLSMHEIADTPKNENRFRARISFGLDSEISNGSGRRSSRGFVPSTPRREDSSFTEELLADL